MEGIYKKYLIEDIIENITGDIDKSVDSITYSSLEATINKVNDFYKNLSMLYDELFGNTQSLLYLSKRAIERGLSIKSKTSAYFKLECNCEIPIGSRFSLKEFTYVATERLGLNTYTVMCETEGASANNVLGKLTPINFIESLTSAEMTELLIPARDDEDVDSLRSRYIDSFGIKPYGGNRTDYLNMLEQIDGVYSAKVIRGGEGPGTVVIIILDNELKSGSPILPQSVKEIIDPIGSDGLGIGLAPIGHKVYVYNVLEKLININLKVESLYSNDEQTLESITNSIKKYFEVLKKSWHKENKGLIIRLSYIQNYILQDTKIIDILDISLNDDINNIELNYNEIPEINTINLTT